MAATCTIVTGCHPAVASASMMHDIAEKVLANPRPQPCTEESSEGSGPSPRRASNANGEVITTGPQIISHERDLELSLDWLSWYLGEKYNFRRVVGGLTLVQKRGKEILYREHDVPDCFYVIIRGSVVLFHADSDTDEDETNDLHSGEAAAVHEALQNEESWAVIFKSSAMYCVELS